MAAKIMLVEDDTNLSDIYKARLEAESFAIITANDGEAALALAVKEHPDLIISDVMMPKISGFDMLDILRGTDGIKDTKIIMMTALGQSEDKARADKLGADRYLVKSQVTLEDVVKTVHDVLGDEPSPAAVVAAAAPATEPAQAPQPEPAAPTQVPVATAPPAEPVQAPVAVEPTAAIPVATPPDEPSQTADSTTASQAAALSQIEDFVDKQESSSQPVESPAVPTVVRPLAATEATAPAPAPDTQTQQTDTQGDDNGVTIANKKVIKPISDPTFKKPDLAALLAKEEGATPVASSTDGIFAAQAGNVVSPSANTQPTPNDIAL